MIFTVQERANIMAAINIFQGLLGADGQAGKDLRRSVKGMEVFKITNTKPMGKRALKELHTRIFKDRDKLELDAIAQYAAHDSYCACRQPMDDNGPCDCGFEEAMKAIGRMELTKDTAQIERRKARNKARKEEQTQ